MTSHLHADGGSHPRLLRLRSVLTARRQLRWTLFGLLIVVEIALVVPNLTIRADAFSDIAWSWLAAAVGAEAISILAFARMRRSLLRAAGVVIARRQIGVLTLASNAISATAPAGTAVSNVYLYRQLRRIGANTGVVTWTLLAGSIISGLAFSTITIAGTLLSGNTSTSEIVGASALSLVAGALLVGGLATISRHPEPLLRAATRIAARSPGRLRRVLDVCRVQRSARLVIDQLAAIHPRVRDWSAALALSILNWTADLACFVLCLYAVGADRISLSMAVLAYVAGLATIGLTVTPGGLGSVEAGMLIVLTHGGVGNPLALAGIVVYRLVAYVFVGAVGWAAWLGIRRREPMHIREIPAPAEARAVPPVLVIDPPAAAPAVEVAPAVV